MCLVYRTWCSAGYRLVQCTGKLFYILLKSNMFGKMYHLIPMTNLTITGSWHSITGTTRIRISHHYFSVIYIIYSRTSIIRASINSEFD
jgi:hypothetical protein